MHKQRFIQNNTLFTNYVKMSWRTLLKSRQTALINISGLVIGFIGCFFIGLYILDELSYDQFFPNNERVYRVTTTFNKQSEMYHSAQSKGSIGLQLRNELAEVEATTRLMPADEAFLFSDESAFKEDIIYTDSSFLKVFGLQLLVGNTEQCLANPSSLIISEQIARKLFGDNWHQQNVLGKTLSLDGRIPLSVTGVFKDFPQQAHFRSDLFASVPSGLESWMSADTELYTYVLLHPHSNYGDLDKKLSAMVRKFFPANLENNTQIKLQSLSDIYLFSSVEDDNAIHGSIKNIYGLLMVALFLITITVINFANLYTANSFNRLKEIGVRKSMGALQGQLQRQFLAETGLVAIMALVFALASTSAAHIQRTNRETSSG